SSSCAAHYITKPPLERASDADVERRPIGRILVVVSPRGARGHSERNKVESHDVGRELRADRCLHAVEMEGLRPGFPGVRENRAMYRVEEQRPCAGATLRTHDRK